MDKSDQKRRLKTPSQVKALENIYAEHKYPSDAMKEKLSKELGLSEKQVQRWFRHRRLKEKMAKKEDPEEQDAGSGNNLKPTLARSQNQRILSIADYPSAVLAAELTDHELLKGDRDVIEDAYLSASPSPSPSLSPSPSPSPGSGSCCEIRASGSGEFLRVQMGMGMEHGIGRCVGGGFQQKYLRAENKRRFSGTPNYPYAQPRGWDYLVLKGNHDDVIKDPYAGGSQERSSLQSGSSYEMEVRRRPSLRGENPFEMEARRGKKKKKKQGLQMDMELPYRQEVAEHDAISTVKDQLGMQFQADGPVLGVEFDPLPPGAFGSR